MKQRAITVLQRPRRFRGARGAVAAHPVGVPRAALHAAFALGSGAEPWALAFLPC